MHAATIPPVAGPDKPLLPTRISKVAEISNLRRSVLQTRHPQAMSVVHQTQHCLQWWKLNWHDLHYCDLHCLHC